MTLSKLGTSAARRRRTVPGVELGVRGFPVSRRGLVRRLACGLLACLLVLHLAFFPVRARATLAAGALTAVGFAVTVTAFLNLAGIYPFNPDTGEGLTFPEWTDDALQKLIDLYNVAHASAPLTQQTIKSYAVGATIAVANAGWNRLRDFVQWIRETYAPADNMQGIKLGENLGVVPYFSSAPSVASLRSNGLSLLGNGSGRYYYVGLSSDEALPSGAVAVCRGNNYFYYYFCGGYRTSAASGERFLYWIYSDYASDGSISGSSSSVQSYIFTRYATGDNGLSVWFLRLGQLLTSSVDSVPFPVFDTETEIINYFSGLSGGNFSGIVSDTTTVSIPAEPVAGSDFTGMQVGGLGQGVTADTLEDVIESGVQSREQPTVRQVEVEIQAGTEVDVETGEVVENPVVVTPDSVPLVASDYAIPGLHTVFPFSIPWDVYNVFSALNAEPVRPSFDASLYVPILDVSIPFKIAIPDEISEDVDSFVALARSLFLVLMCVATLLFVRNLIR